MTTRNQIGKINHPVHGVYFIYKCDEGRFGISRHDVESIHCGYATLEALFKTKGL